MWLLILGIAIGALWMLEYHWNQEKMRERSEEREREEREPRR
jgi:hypothetical protein